MTKPGHDLTILTEFRTPSTYSAVGTRLGVAHTTVARKIRELESYFGTPLVERIGDALNLTEAGLRAAEAGERMDAELAALERKISAHDQDLTGKVTLTTVDILASRYMPAIAAFTRRYPGIELKLETDPTVRSLSRREAEVALRLTNAPDEYLSGLVLERFEFYPYQRARDYDPAVALDQLCWLDYERNQCAARSEQWMSRHANGAHPQLFVSTPLAMLEAVRQGAGVGMLPSAIADEDSELRRVSDISSFGIDIWLLTPRELRKSARVRALFSALRDHPREAIPRAMDGRALLHTA